MDSQDKITILKYLATLAGKFEEIRTGVEKNELLWEPFNINSKVISGHIERIISKGKEVELLKKKLSEKLSEARELKDKEKKIFEQFEKRAVGIHADDETKLTEYGIK